MAVKFLELYEGTEIVKGNQGEHCNLYERVFVQEDIWDFHVLRLMRGDYDGGSEGYTVEYEKIDKVEILEEMNLYESGMEVRDVFTSLYDYEVIVAVLKIDQEKGFENYGYENFESYEEAVDFITKNDSYEVKVLEFINEPEQIWGEMKIGGALVESEILLRKILDDKRFTGFENVIINAYQNCREHGYALNFNNLLNENVSITFSRVKGGDDLIVYYGKNAATTVHPEACENLRVFSQRDFKGARDYILSILERDALKGNVADLKIEYSDSLKVAKKVLFELSEDNDFKSFKGNIECLQAGKYQGHALYPFETKGSNSVLISISGTDENNIIIHSGRYSPHGLPEHQSGSEKVFEMENVKGAIAYIVSELKAKCNNVKKSVTI